jgi:hypothetical protein
MSTPRQRHISLSRFPIASFAVAAPGLVSSQAAGAYIGYSGDDWVCEDGLRKHGEACVPD